MQKGKELNDFQRNPLDIEILSNLRFGSLEIRDTSVTRVTNNVSDLGCRETLSRWNPSKPIKTHERVWIPTSAISYIT